MIRALYTAASGMNSQQANIDNIAHNLANVNTTGFKKSRVEFEDLVYQRIKAAGTPSAEGETPIGLEAGLGSRAVATARNFSSGSLRMTGSTMDMAIEGSGFFQVSLPGGETGFTRAGMFHVNGQGEVVTNEGYALEPALTIPANARRSRSRGRRRLGHCQARARRGRWAPSSLRSSEPGRPRARGGGDFAVTNASGDPTTATAPTGWARCCGSSVERQRRRGDGQHDPGPARLRGQLEGDSRRRRDAAGERTGPLAWGCPR
jgi:flagellar basal-body rod protein FlgG